MGDYLPDLQERHLASLLERQKANSEMNHVEFVQKRGELVSLPRRVVLELTNRCGHRCLPCGRDAGNFVQRDLPVETIRRFEGILGFAEEIVLHGWGEGTLHPLFAEILCFLDSIPGLRKHFVTDGTTLHRIHWLIFEHRINALTVHLDGVCPTTGAFLQDAGYGDKVSMIRALLGEKERRGFDFPSIDIVFTAMRKNLPALPELIRWVAELRLSSVTVEYLTVFSPEQSSDTLYNRQEEVRRVFAEARRAAERFGVRLRLPPIQEEDAAGDDPHRLCPLPWRDLFVGSDGCLRPCRASGDVLGNAAAWENFYEIWNAPPVQEFRTRVNTPASMPECCSRCWHPESANVNQRHAFLQLTETPPVLRDPLHRRDGRLGSPAV